MNRTSVANFARGYSERKTPEMIPIGIARVAAIPIRISVPTIALAMPPPASPTGLGIFVKKSQLSEEKPCWMT